MADLKVELPKEAWARVLGIVSTAPYREVYQIIENVTNQLDAQEAPMQARVKEPVAAPKPKRGKKPANPSSPALQ